MATLDSLQFEMERRVILFKPTTTMPDLSQLSYNADPNAANPSNTDGEFLIYHSPNGTRYLNTDVSGNTITEWYKKAQPNGWLPLGSGDSSTGLSSLGTDSSTWQLNLSNSGVVLQSDGSSNLIIKDGEGNDGTLIVGGLKLGDSTGYLKAIDGSVYIEAGSGLLTATGTLAGDNITASFVIDHSINSLNHLVSVYEPTNEVIYPDISIGANSDRITFSAPVPLGTDYRLVIIGF